MKKKVLSLLLAFVMVLSMSVFAYAEAGVVEPEVVGIASSTITVYPIDAPNIAQIILDKEGVKSVQSIGKGKTKVQLNLISEVAHQMGPRASFNGVEKSVTVNDEKVCNPDYWQAVLDFLNNEYGLNLSYSLADYIEDLNEGGGGDPGVLPATSNWTMEVDLQSDDGSLTLCSVVMNVDGSTISGTFLQAGTPPQYFSPFSGTLDGHKFTGTWISSMGLPYVGAMEWTFNAAFDGFTGDFWYANDTGNPKAFYAGPITNGTLVP